METTKKRLRSAVAYERTLLRSGAHDKLLRVISDQRLDELVAREAGAHRTRLYPPRVTLGLFVEQVMSADGACQDAVGRHPSDTFGMRVVIDDPVCPATVLAAGGDTGEDSMFFEVTRRYFQSFQNILCADPSHWNYWDTLQQRSTAFKPYRESSPDGPSILLSELERLARALAPRFNQSPAFESRFAEFHVHYKSRLGE